MAGATGTAASARAQARRERTLGLVRWPETSLQHHNRVKQGQAPAVSLEPRDQAELGPVKQARAQTMGEHEQPVVRPRLLRPFELPPLVHAEEVVLHEATLKGGPERQVTQEV